MWLACLNLSGVCWGTPRATMRVAPDDPKKPLGFIKPIFMSGSSPGRLAVHIICCSTIAKPEKGSWYSCISRVRPPWCLALLQTRYDWPLSPRRYAPACWPRRRPPHWSGVAATASVPSRPGALLMLQSQHINPGTLDQQASEVLVTALADP